LPFPRHLAATVNLGFHVETCLFGVSRAVGARAAVSTAAIVTAAVNNDDIGNHFGRNIKDLIVKIGFVLV